MPVEDHGGLAELLQVQDLLHHLHQVAVSVQEGELGLQVVLEQQHVLVLDVVHQHAVLDVGVSGVEEHEHVHEGVEGRVVLHHIFEALAKVRVLLDAVRVPKEAAQLGLGKRPEEVDPGPALGDEVGGRADVVPLQGRRLEDGDLVPLAEGLELGDDPRELHVLAHGVLQREDGLLHAERVPLAHALLVFPREDGSGALVGGGQMGQRGALLHRQGPVQLHVPRQLLARHMLEAPPERVPGATPLALVGVIIRRRRASPGVVAGVRGRPRRGGRVGRGPGFGVLRGRGGGHLSVPLAPLLFAGLRLVSLSFALPRSLLLVICKSIRSINYYHVCGTGAPGYAPEV